MRAFGNICFGLSLAGLLAVGACSTQTVTASDIRHYTSIALCPTASVSDLTTQEERDTVPGFSFHVMLKMDAPCAISFERQLAAVAPVECVRNRLHVAGCYAIGNETKTAMHTTIVVRPTGKGLYDLRFFD